MAIYTPEQIYQVARQAGFSVDQAIRWTAIAMAESGGNTRANARNASENSVGLWQINLKANSRLVRGRDPYDPLVNATIAYELSNRGTNWKPWTVTLPTRNGRPNPNYYARHLPRARQAAGLGGSEMVTPNAYNPPGSGHFNSPINNVLPNVGPVIYPLRGHNASELTRSGIGDPRPGHLHKGLDMMAPFNTPIVSATNGIIHDVGVGGGKFGFRVNIQDPAGNIHSYAHMNKNPAELGFRVGQPVYAGQLIGYVGNSGTGGTAPHLHYSINEAQYNVNRGRAVIDPYRVLTGGIGYAGMTDSYDSTLTGAEASGTAEDLFPQFMGFMSIPGVPEIIAEAVREGYGIGWVKSRLEQLPWWQTTAEHRREAQALKETDPRSFDAKVQAKAEEILDSYSKLGITPPFEDFASVFLGPTINRNSNLYRTAETYYLGDFSAQAIGRIAIRDTLSPGMNIGAVANTMEELAGLANDYFIRYSATQLEDLAVKITKGEYSTDQFVALLKQQAKGLFAYDKNLMQQIDNGVTPETLFATHRQVLANELEVSADSIDFLDSKFHPILNHIDAKTGANRSMTVNETLQLARRLPQYEKTRGAMTNVSEFVKSFEGIFGRG